MRLRTTSRPGRIEHPAWRRRRSSDIRFDSQPVLHGNRQLPPISCAGWRSYMPDDRPPREPGERSELGWLHEIRAGGYVCGYTQLKEFVRRVRPTPAPEPVIRFETLAGRQAQVDFARFLPGAYAALLVVLGYSRLLWCRFYPRQDLATLVAGLEEAGWTGLEPAASGVTDQESPTAPSALAPSTGTGLQSRGPQVRVLPAARPRFARCYHHVPYGDSDSCTPC
jgi:hypothetical protein